jgi:hypothetical protein
VHTNTLAFVGAIVAQKSENCNKAFPWGEGFYPVGKSYASIVDDEKTSFLGRIKTKNPATFIIAGFPAMDGQRRLWIDSKFLDFCVLAVYNSIRQPV